MPGYPFDLVIFDCDGVLVDSEPIANEVFSRMLKELGLEIGIDEMYAQFVGRSMADCMRLVEERLGYAPPPDFVTKLQERTFQAFEAGGLQPTPGIEEVLDAIPVPVCVASSGEVEKMRFTLGLTGLLPRFDGYLFSVTEVAHAKPAPDIYLYAAERMRADSRRCAVIEDSLFGAQAGVAAGMTVFGYSAHTDAQALRRVGAHQTFAAMRELPRLLERADVRAARNGASRLERS